jgi:RNA polymerase sigma factor (sigma-70 family)
MLRRAFRGAFSDDEIEDIYGNAWLGTLRALERRHSDLEDEEIRKYVFTAVAHHASKELRRRKRRPTTPIEDVREVADSGISPDESAARLEDSRVTRDLLGSLPPRRRAVLLFRYGWGLEPNQVCGLVKGLSHRAYRKEITRGVDELTEKLRLHERGEWCSDREPVLKAFAAGIADGEQERQAQQHLAHCRHCTDFVSRLSGHLHDLGSSVVLTGAADAAGDGQISVATRIGDLAHRAQEAMANPFGRSAAETSDATGQAAVVSSGARGAGAAGGGVVAKIAGLGAGGKLALACLASGAAVTTCAATGVIPGLELAGRGQATQAAAQAPPHHRPGREPHRLPVFNPADVKTDRSNEPARPAASQTPATAEPAPAQTTATTTTATSPVAPTTPPVEQEFGVASAADTSSTDAGSSSGGGGGDSTAAGKEFGP